MIVLSKKKTFALIFLLAFISWAIISLNYYNKHAVTVKEHYVGKEIELSAGTVFIRNIEIHDYEEELTFDRNEWFYDSFLPQIPDKLRQPIMTVKAFYSDRYNSDLGTDKVDGRMMYVNGIYVSTKKNNLLSDSRKHFKADVYTVQGGNLTFGSNGTSASESSNMMLFNSRDRFFLNEYSPKNSDNLILKVKDKIANRNHEIIINPEWKTRKYNFFNKPPGDLSFSPEKVANRFIDTIVLKEALNTARKMIHPEISDFPWKNLSHDEWSKMQETVTKYIAKYKGFDDVFSIRIVFARTGDEFDNNFSEQTIYIVDYDGEWKVIDVSLLITEANN